MNEAAAIIKESAHPEVNLIFGAQIDENMGDELRITVIATGFEQSRAQRKMEAQLQPRQPVARPVQQPQQQQAPRPVQQQQQPTNLPLEQPYAPPQPRPAQQPPMQDVPARVYDEDDIDIPTFLRKRK